MSLTKNFTIDSDAYKVTQWLMYKPGLSKIVSYGESRLGSVFPTTLFTGARKIIVDHLEGQVITKEKIAEGLDKSGSYFGTTKYFNLQMWNHILNKYGGMLPLRIKAVKEGTNVPINNVLYKLEALDEKCVPLVQHTETLFMQNWEATTVATNGFYFKRDMIKHLERSGTPANVEWRAHNFGYRAGGSHDQSIVCSMAWLINFIGDDTLVGDRAAEYYYGYKEPILRSVAASEHSVALMYGPGEGEYEYVHACLDAAEPHLPVSIVIDTFDQNNFIDNVITRPDIVEKVLSRSGPTVWRQDSGNALENTLRNLNSLSISYGYSFNDKHYKIINPKVSLLQGDAMSRDKANVLLESIQDQKWSVDNVIVAAGTGFVNDHFTRDTQRFAIKPCQFTIDEKEVNVQKVVKSQPDKASKPGDLKLHQTGKDFMTISSAKETKANFDNYSDCLQTILEMGESKNKQSYDEVRAIAKSYL